jgi:hypothetical protein
VSREEQPLQAPLADARGGAQLAEAAHAAVGLGQLGYLGDLARRRGPLRFQGLLQEGGERRDAGHLVWLDDDVPQQRHLVRADGWAQRDDPVGEIGRRRAD